MSSLISGKPCRRVCRRPISRRSGGAFGSRFLGDQSVPTCRSSVHQRVCPPLVPNRPRRPSSSRRPVTVKVAHDQFREPFIEIYTRGDEGKRLVTSIEVLSLSNKTPGEQGRELYVRKQKEVLASKAHLVEIDLLRAGEHVSAVPLEAATEVCGDFDYHISVRCFDIEDSFFVYPIHLEERLPPIDVPLLPGDPPVTLDLQAVFDRCSDAGPYSREIRYGEDKLAPASRPNGRGGRANWFKPGTIPGDRAIHRPLLSLGALGNPSSAGTELPGTGMTGPSYLTAFLYFSRRSLSSSSMGSYWSPLARRMARS